MSGIDSLNIKRRICLGITKFLRLGQYICKIAAFIAHLSQDEIAGAINNSGKPADLVGGQPLTQCLDDRNSTSNRRFKRDRYTPRLRPFKEQISMLGNQRFISSHNMFA